MNTDRKEERICLKIIIWYFNYLKKDAFQTLIYTVTNERKAGKRIEEYTCIIGIVLSFSEYFTTV